MEFKDLLYFKSDVLEPPGIGDVIGSPDFNAGLSIDAFLAEDNGQSVLEQLLKTHNGDPEIIKDVEVSKDRRNDGQGTSQRWGKQMYIDGPHALVINKKRGTAIVWAGIKVNENGVNIVQLQSRREMSHWLPRLGRWEKVLVGITEAYARSVSKKEVCIRPGEENGWVRIGRVPLERAKMRYDVTARRMDYVYDERRRKFVKELR